MSNAKCIACDLKTGKRGPYTEVWVELAGNPRPMRIYCTPEDSPQAGEPCSVYLMPDYRCFAKVYVHKVSSDDSSEK